MRARLIKEAIDFKRGHGSKEALGVGLFRNLFDEKPPITGIMRKNFWNLYPYEEYKRLLKEYINHPAVQEFIDKHNINYIQPEIQRQWDNNEESDWRTEIAYLEFFNGQDLRGLGKLYLAKTRDYDLSRVGPEKNRMYNEVGQEWDKFLIKTDRESIFDRH